MDAKRFRNVGIKLMRGCAACAVILALGANQKDEVKETTLVPAVYLRHIGDSDKPIFPIVVAAVRPADSELKRVLGADEWEHANVTIVTEDLLRSIIAEVYKSVTGVAVKQEDKGHAFGTFQVTVTEPRNEKQRSLPKDTPQISRTLSRVEIPATLRAMETAEKASATRNEDLRGALASLKRRLGMEVAP